MKKKNHEDENKAPQISEEGNTAGLTAEEEEETIKTLLIPAWEQWQDEVISDSETALLATKICANIYGCTETSPLALMFSAFVGGVGKGVELYQRLNEIENEGGIQDKIMDY